MSGLNNPITVLDFSDSFGSVLEEKPGFRFPATACWSVKAQKDALRCLL